jgi:C4-dicarboxylate-specific signal transduction histidine kinase
MLRVNGERVAIRVADNGIGISPADLSRFSLMDLRQKRMATGLDCIPELLLPNNWEAL